MENKPFEKSVYFYRMFPNPSFGINAPTESQRLHQMFERIFSTGCMIYPYSDFSHVHRFEINSFDDKHVFGVYSREETSPNPFMQFRETDTNHTAPVLDSNEPNKVLEYYTFFYVDFGNLMAAVIYNRQAGLMEKVLPAFFHEGMCLLDMIPYSITDIGRGMSKFKKINKIEYSYNKKNADHKYQTLGQLDAHKLDLVVDTYQVKIGIKQYGPKFLKNVKELPPDTYSSFKITGMSNEDIEQSFDVIQKSFVSSAKIKIDTNPQENLDNIKHALSREINKIMNY